MAKIFKFTGYFVDPAGECSKRDVKTALEEVTTNNLYEQIINFKPWYERESESENQ